MNYPVARRLLIVPLIVLVFTLGMAGFAASPALADHWPLCSGSSGFFCVFKNNGGHDGGVKLFGGNDGNYSGNNFERCFVNCDVNDATSSLWNRENYGVRAYVNSSHTGAFFNTSSGTKRFSMPSGFNDAISSHRD
jgi:hypothetical protein